MFEPYDIIYAFWVVIIGGLIGGTSRGSDSGILPGVIVGGLLGSTTPGAQKQKIIGYIKKV